MRTFSFNQAATEAAYKQAGFTEIRKIFEDAGSIQLSSNYIRNALINNFNFTQGQASGALRRAHLKQLLFHVGNAEYMYNIDFPHSVASYINKSDKIDDEQFMQYISSDSESDFTDSELESDPNTEANTICSDYDFMHMQSEADAFTDFARGIHKVVIDSSTISNIFNYDVEDVIVFYKVIMILKAFADAVFTHNYDNTTVVSDDINSLISNVHDVEIFRMLYNNLSAFYVSFCQIHTIADMDESTVKELYDVYNIFHGILDVLTNILTAAEASRS